MANGHDETRELGRGRARQIFRFLKDFNGLRNPTRRQIAEQPWVMWLNEVPQHSHVWLRGRDVDPKNTGEPNELLKVRRPDVPPPPALPRVLDGWFPPNWKDPSIKAVEPFTERETPGPDNARVIEKFVASSDRVRAHAQWKPKREEWAREAVIARQVLGIFNRFYELQGRLEREGESVQLLLGQGVLLWRRDDGDIRHPVITQRLELSFDPYIPQFEIVETDQPAELLRPLLFADQPQAAQTIQ